MRMTITTAGRDVAIVNMYSHNGSKANLKANHCHEQKNTDVIRLNLGVLLSKAGRRGLLTGMEEGQKSDPRPKFIS